MVDSLPSGNVSATSLIKKLEWADELGVQKGSLTLPKSLDQFQYPECAEKD
jgi:hypothetical protein